MHVWWSEGNFVQICSLPHPYLALAIELGPSGLHHQTRSFSMVMLRTDSHLLILFQAQPPGSMMRQSNVS